MAEKKQISTKSLKNGHAYDNNLQSKHGPWGNEQSHRGPYGDNITRNPLHLSDKK